MDERLRFVARLLEGEKMGSSVDFDRRMLTIEGRNAKSRQTRHMPLNDEAMSVLHRWREQSGGKGYFSTSPRDSKLRGRNFSDAPGSPAFAGTTCVITSPRAWSSAVCR
jgi:integrase